MKKFFGLLLGLIITLNIIAYPVYGAQGAPSDWAMNEVNKAIENGLVPDVLTNNYQNDIKRYEYVLLALELLDLNKDSVIITQKYPFSDIVGHVYEEEIVRAFNAGIIKGDGKGSFRPNDPITRQEIASLVVNLVKRLQQVETVDMSVKYTFSDKATISEWALGYIHYCYNNNVMKGVGKDKSGIDIINPLGKASREQAMLLLYRLAISSGLLADYNLGTITVVEYTVNDYYELDPNPIKGYVESTVINDFARTFGLALATRVKELSQLETVEIGTINTDYIRIDFINEGNVSISKNGYAIELELVLKDLSNEELINTFIELNEILYDIENLQNAVYRSITGFNSDVNFKFNQKISDNEIFTSFSEVVNDEAEYVFQYQHNSN